jgi:hypothetical protein
MSVLVSKFKDVLYAVLPITIIVLVLNYTLTPLDSDLLTKFIIGAALVIIGLSVFLLGVDIGVTPIGNQMGSTLTKSNSVWMIVLVGLLLGFFISIAEPDLHVLAGEVFHVSNGLVGKAAMVVVVSVGVAALLSLGLLRIVYSVPLPIFLTITYFGILILAFFVSPGFLAIAFDASGATTGAMTTPFILALAVGVSSLKKDSRASEVDSFGLVGIVSAGAIIAVMIMSTISGGAEISGIVDSSIEVAATSIFSSFLSLLPTIAGEIAVAMLPITITFLLFQKISFKLSKRSFRRIIVGLVLSYFGLVLFLLGVNAGFMDLGVVLGYSLASLDSKVYVVIVGFALGLVTVLAEPAVYVLTHQVEDVTSGSIKRKVVMIALSMGVGLAVALSMLRITVREIQLWHYLLPGYIVSIALSHIVPSLFVGIAFDSGGVASGPMTATFILAFAQGVAAATEGANVLVDGFGMIAMVAMAPLLALQILGLVFEMKSKKEGIRSNAR